MKTSKWFGNQFRSSKWIAFKRKVKQVTIVLFVMCLMGQASYWFRELSPKTVVAQVPVVQYVTATSTMPILSRIAKCESGQKQFASNGQVLMKANTNGSVDAGYMQINMTIWGKKATAMGYDLTKEKDNKAFGEWLFVNYGSEPWYLTKNCWSK